MLFHCTQESSAFGYFLDRPGRVAVICHLVSQNNWKNPQIHVLGWNSLSWDSGVKSLRLGMAGFWFTGLEALRAHQVRNTPWYWHRWCLGLAALGKQLHSEVRERRGSVACRGKGSSLTGKDTHSHMHTHIHYCPQSGPSPGKFSAFMIWTSANTVALSTSTLIWQTGHRGASASGEV